MKKFCKIFILTFFLFIVLSCLLIFLGYRYLKYSYPKKSFVSEKIQVALEKNESLKNFSQKLEDNKIIDNKNIFRIWVKFFSDYSKYQQGNYLFTKKDTIRRIDKKIKLGKTYNPIVYKITIPEGFTFKQICEKIKNSGLASFDECHALFKDKEIMDKYKINALSLEGYLYPLTYSYIKMPSLRELIETMVKTFFEKLPKDYEEKLKNFELTLNDAVIMASLIELESADPEERRKISGVIWNRLNAKMPLGIDASLIYGIDNYKGNISHKDLKDSENKFNTRLHGGLPPSAIASPSIESLESVINPESHNFYYYVLDFENFKKHIFSKSLKEHNFYVRKYIKAYKERNKKKENL